MVKSKPAPEISPHVVVQLLDSAIGRPIRTWQFDSTPLISIGRAPEQHVQIDDPYVSRSHAELRFNSGEWSLISLGRYGVQVEGQAITEIPIRGELTFRLGASGPTLRFNPAAPRHDNRMTMMFDSTLVEDLFALDASKLERDVSEISQGDYFQQLQKRARELRKPQE
jgi:serine/threonine protein kinase, bacterial